MEKKSPDKYITKLGNTVYYNFGSTAKAISLEEKLIMHYDCVKTNNHNIPTTYLPRKVKEMFVKFTTKIKVLEEQYEQVYGDIILINESNVSKQRLNQPLHKLAMAKSIVNDIIKNHIAKTNDINNIFDNDKNYILSKNLFNENNKCNMSLEEFLISYDKIKNTLNNILSAKAHNFDKKLTELQRIIKSLNYKNKDLSVLLKELNEKY
jgi:hypothetical protein